MTTTLSTAANHRAALNAALEAWETTVPTQGNIRINQGKREDALLAIMTIRNKELVADTSRALGEIFPCDTIMSTLTVAARFDISFDVELPDNFREALRTRLLSNMPDDDNDKA